MKLGQPPPLLTTEAAGIGMPVPYAARSIVHGPGAGRRALAVTLLSGPCLALLVFHTFFGLIFIGESPRNWIPGPSILHKHKQTIIVCLISIVGLLFSERILSIKS